MSTNLITPPCDEFDQLSIMLEAGFHLKSIPHCGESFAALPWSMKHTAFVFPDSGTRGGRNVALLSCALFFKSLRIPNDATAHNYVFNIYDDGKRRFEDVTRAFEKIYNGEHIRKSTAAYQGPDAQFISPQHLDKYDRITRDDIEEMQEETDLGDDIDAARFVESLFLSGEHIWVGGSVSEAWRKPLVRDQLVAELRDNLDDNDYFYTTGSHFQPNAYGLNERGAKSYRRDECVQEEAYMVIESDSDEAEEQERMNGFCFSLSKHIPLASIVFSGNRSLHYYFNVRGLDKADKQAFISLAVMHGADLAVLRSPQQPSRFPNVNAMQSDNERGAQVLLYLVADAAEHTPTAEGLHRMREMLMETKESARQQAAEQKLAENFADTADESTNGKTLTHGDTYTFCNLRNTYKVDKKYLVADADGKGFAAHTMNKDVLISAIQRGLAEEEIMPPYVDKYASAEEKKTEEYIEACQLRDKYNAMVQERYESISLDRAADAHGAISGLKCGIHNFLGTRFLVDCEPEYVPLVDAGSAELTLQQCPNVMEIMYQAFRERKALNTFLAWLRHGIECVNNGKHTPSQMVVLAGQAGAGKTLMSSIVKKLFGNRAADPSKCWGSEMLWNDDLLGAELLLMDDADADTDFKSRRNRGQQFKTSIYTDQVAIRKRGTTTIQSMRPVWKVMACCNESEEALAVIPMVGRGKDDSAGMYDKISLYRMPKLDMDLLDRGKEEAWRVICGELPHFAAWLMNYFILPEEYADENNRAPSTDYKDRHLLNLVTNDASPEDNVLFYIQDDLAARHEGRMEESVLEFDKNYRPAKIHSLLADKQDISRSFLASSRSASILGKQLTTLMNDKTKGVESHMSGNNKLYRFTREVITD